MISNWAKQRQAEKAAEKFKPGWYLRGEKARQERLDKRRELVRHHAAKRKAMKLQRTPAWADMAAIRDFYKEALQLTEQTGVKYVVDHIIPLQGRLVCGLHVQNNLQVITSVENCQKHNHFEID